MSYFRPQPYPLPLTPNPNPNPTSNPIPDPNLTLNLTLTLTLIVILILTLTLTLSLTQNPNPIYNLNPLQATIFGGAIASYFILRPLPHLVFEVVLVIVTHNPNLSTNFYPY